ncbi:NAD(+)/NADH kinase [Opitutales bacterium]|jgi:NAD+ kinase|nr:NAD(+)/NADH kinase [Opitutales bacterium]
MNPPRLVSIINNLSKPGAKEVGRKLEELCQGAGVKVRATDEFPCPDGFLENSDICFSVGGDGTLLHLLNDAVKHEVPVAGVGLGKLGFLATISPGELDEALPPMLQGKYFVRQRSLLGYSSLNGAESLALNDLVVKSGTSGRLGRFSVHAGHELVAEYACDGIVFSTPTGSTAYNLASGGPIAHPEAKVMLMTPISAHTLTSRPVVFPAGMKIRVEIEGSQPVPSVFADGREAFSADPHFPLEVSTSDRSFPLLEVEKHSHFRVMRNKLKWG